jgi:hypothetical protein
MPLYYDVKKPCTSNGSANTLSTHLRAATVANQMMCRIMGLYGAARHGVAGGGVLYGIRPTTAGSGGTSQTPTKRNPNAQAAQTAWTDDNSAITPGGTPLTQITVGVAQTGGQGGWVALDQDHAVQLLPGAAAATGNFEVASKFNGTSVVFEPLCEFSEA